MLNNTAISGVQSTAQGDAVCAIDRLHLNGIIGIVFQVRCGCAIIVFVPSLPRLI